MGDDPNRPRVGWTPDDITMADLRAWLVDRGFAVLSDRYDSESFGNQEVVLARPVAIRLVKDRDQWSVDIAGVDGQFNEIRRWRDALRGPGAQLLSTAEQADILRKLLDDIEAHPASPDR